jgi:hypothetical protein
MASTNLTAHDVAGEEGFGAGIHTGALGGIKPTDQAEVFEGKGGEGKEDHRDEVAGQVRRANRGGGFRRRGVGVLVAQLAFRGRRCGLHGLRAVRLNRLRVATRLRPRVQHFLRVAATRGARRRGVGNGPKIVPRVARATRPQPHTGCGCCSNKGLAREPGAATTRREPVSALVMLSVRESVLNEIIRQKHAGVKSARQ